MLAAKPDAVVAYAKARKVFLDPIEAQSNKLSTVLDNSEVQAAEQRQMLEAAMRVRNAPGGVVVTSAEVSLAIRGMVDNLRLLMLAANEKETGAAQAALKFSTQRLTENSATLRASLLKMGRPPLAAQVDSAAAAVDARVQSLLTLMLGIAAAIIAASAVISWRTVPTVTRQLDQAVRVAEAVSQGGLAAVPPVPGNDEIARLMGALGRMVGTLTGTVGKIQAAASQIHAGPGETSRDHTDLSSRTEPQASQLQQTPGRSNS